MAARKKAVRKKKTVRKKANRSPRKSRSQKLGFVKSFDSWKKKKTRKLKKNRFKLIAFAVLFILGGIFLFFQDYREDAQQFESIIKSVVKNSKGVTIASRRLVPSENWRAKWNEISFVIRTGPAASSSALLGRIKKKLPAKFQLYREVVTETGTAHSVSTEFRHNHIPIARLRIESKKKHVSTEFLAKEKEVVKPKTFFSLPKILTQPKKKKKRVVSKPKPKKVTPKPRVTPPSKVKERAKVVIVIDDVGNSNKYYPDLFSLPRKVTIAILPRLTFSREALKIGKQKGFEMILHQPVEALHHNDALGPGGVFVGQSGNEIEAVIGKNLDSLRGITGSNNHMGSRGTQDAKLMSAYMGALKKRKLFYLDSWTTRKSVGRDAARRKDVPYLRRAVFLDNVDTPAAIRRQVEELMQAAKQEGVAIGIGHIRKNTVDVLREMIPKMERAGIQIVRLKDLL